MPLQPLGVRPGWNAGMVHDEPDIVTVLLDAATKPEALDALLAHLVEEGAVPIAAAPEVHAAILRRAALGPIGIGKGVVFASARHACVARLLLALARLTTPNDDWESLDDEPVNVVFLG